MKKVICGVLLFAVVALLCACGVSQSDYDDLQRKYDKLSAEYDALSEKYDTLSAVYDASKESFDTLVDFSDSQSETIEFYKEQVDWLTDKLAEATGAPVDIG